MGSIYMLSNEGKSFLLMGEYLSIDGWRSGSSEIDLQGVLLLLMVKLQSLKLMALIACSHQT